MAAFQKSYRNIEEFEREEIRPSFRIGFSFEDLVQEAEFEGELSFEAEDEFVLDRIDDDEDDDEDVERSSEPERRAVNRRSDDGGGSLWDE